MTCIDNTWSYMGSKAFSAGAAYVPTLALHPATGVPYVSFRDGDSSYRGASVMTFNGSAWSLVGSKGFSTVGAFYTRVALHQNSSAPYVAFKDDNSKMARVMTFNGSTWSLVGSAGFSAGEANWVSLALHPNTTAPHVAFTDGGNSKKATVMTFPG